MTETRPSLPRYALESLVYDTAFFFTLIKRAVRHQHSGLIMYGMMPLTSLFVVESYDYLADAKLDIQNALGPDSALFVRAARHRAKLFGTTPKLVNRVLGTIRAIIESHREYFNRDHVGLFGPFKRFIQPDLGMTTFNGHMISTTHQPTYNFGEPSETSAMLSIDQLGEVGYEFGRVVSSYVRQLTILLGIEITDQAVSQHLLQGEFVMKDVKSKALFSRGPIGTLSEDLAAAMVVLLTHINYVNYVLRALAPVELSTFFKIRFISAYHAAHSLRILREIARRRVTTGRLADHVFQKLLNDADFRWIAGQLQLRNMLVHYGPKQHTSGRVALDAPLRDAVEHLARGRRYADIDVMLDRFLALVSRTIEEGFEWSKNVFWYGRVD